MAALIHNCHLSEDLVTEILVRLPVKSLLQFKLVCKQWQDVITRLSFIRKHFHHEANHTRLLLYSYGYSDPYRLNPDDTYNVSLYPDETLERLEHERVDLPGPLKSVVGPCNGVYCVSNMSHKLALWNPTTRRLAPLPVPPERLYKNSEIGFEMDPSTNEFKIILVYLENDKDHVQPCYPFSLYTSSNDTWRYFENDTPFDNDSFVSELSCGTTLLNGFYYWIKTNSTTLNSVIISFNMHNEVFQEIEMPEVVRSKDVDLDLYEDSLALLSYDTGVNDSRIGVWLMKEQGCWTKLYTVVLPYRFLCPVGLWKNNKILVFTQPQKCVHELVMYDVNSHDTRTLRVENGEKPFHAIYPLSFKESLVSVKYKPGIQDYDISDASSNFFVHKLSKINA